MVTVPVPGVPPVAGLLFPCPPVAETKAPNDEVPPVVPGKAGLGPKPLPPPPPTTVTLT